jgi:hypothetical protein
MFFGVNSSQKGLLNKYSVGKNSAIAQCAALGLKLGAVKTALEKKAITSFLSMELENTLTKLADKISTNRF